MQLVVTPEEAGKRVDVIVAHHSGSPRSVVAEAVRRAQIQLNGEPVKGSHLAAEGDKLEYRLSRRPPLVVEPEAIDLAIVYEDEDVIVVDKAAGMVTHPAHGATSGTLAQALLAHAGALPGDALRPGLVHRLDRDTSGLLVVAKNQAALSKLGKAMKARAISREYLALVSGSPPHPKGTIEGAIGRDPHNRLKYAIIVGGKPATTHYEIAERLRDAAELRVWLDTGRTHQIRVHLAALGHPVLNDPLYGKVDRRFDLPGQALHAWRVAFPHPRTGEPMKFEVDPPAEYIAARALLRVPAA